LKRSTVFLGVFIILASSFLIEYYTNTRFPTNDLVVSHVPELEVGRVHRFSYVHKLVDVGTTTYILTKKQGDMYTLESSSDVMTESGRIQLESNFIFDEWFKPKSYILNVDQNGELDEIEVNFTENKVVSKVTVANETVTLSDEFPETAYMVENNMPGFWEILLLSSDLDMGARYTVKVYIPQGGTLFDLQFYVQNDPKTITVEGQQLSCIVIQESTLDLRFYIYDGKMVQMRNEDQDIIFTRLDD
jgi:hypothetical protein